VEITTYERRSVVRVAFIGIVNNLKRVVGAADDVARDVPGEGAVVVDVGYQ
jgi:hypothetical protein